MIAKSDRLADAAGANAVDEIAQDSAGALDEQGIASLPTKSMYVLTVLTCYAATLRHFLVHFIRFSHAQSSWCIWDDLGTA